LDLLNIALPTHRHDKRSAILVQQLPRIPLLIPCPGAEQLDLTAGELRPGVGLRIEAADEARDPLGGIAPANLRRCPRELGRVGRAPVILWDGMERALVPQCERLYERLGADFGEMRRQLPA